MKDFDLKPINQRKRSLSGMKEILFSLLLEIIPNKRFKRVITMKRNFFRLLLMVTVAALAGRPFLAQARFKFQISAPPDWSMRERVRTCPFDLLISSVSGKTFFDLVLQHLLTLFSLTGLLKLVGQKAVSEVIDEGPLYKIFALQ